MYASKHAKGTRHGAKMVVLVCGDRKWNHQNIVDRVLRTMSNVSPITLLIEGGAPGADTCGRLAASKLHIPCKTYPADWAKYGKAAGPIRNRQMLNEGKPDIVLAFHSNIAKSKGTKDMIKAARNAGILVALYTNTGEGTFYNPDEGLF